MQLYYLILEKKSDRVFEVLNDLRALRTPPQMILGSLFSCFAALYKLKALESCPESVRADETGCMPFLVRRYERFLHQIPSERLDELMEFCSQIDVASKSSSADPDLLVVQLLTKAMEVL